MNNNNMTLDNIINRFTLTRSDLDTLVALISKAFEDGLNQANDKYLYSPLQMVLTYLTSIPTGKETGRFFAIDLGGTNLRFIEIHLSNSTLTPTSISYVVSHELMNGKGEDLFDFIAKCLEEGLEHVGMKEKTIDCLGFTFSFPCKQYALNSAVLIKWTKGYTTSGVVNQDIVKLLRKACSKRGFTILDIILINDTTGTLLCGAYENSSTCIGVINGTGTNACYLENISRVPAWDGPSDVREVIINTEWGAFGDFGSLERFRTEFDQKLDKNSINPGFQIYEKMISGMYIGELVRLILLSAAQNGIIFAKNVPSKLKIKDSFTSIHISDSYDKEKFPAKFYQVFEYWLDDAEYETIRKICDTISKRSADLCAIGLVGLLKRVNKPAVIAADGSMFRKHPKFVRYVEQTLKNLLPQNDYSIILVDDGSGKGAALAASVTVTNAKK